MKTNRKPRDKRLLLWCAIATAYLMTCPSRPQKCVYPRAKGGRAPNSRQHDPLALIPYSYIGRRGKRFTVKLEGRLPFHRSPRSRHHVHPSLDCWLSDDDTRRWLERSSRGHVTRTSMCLLSRTLPLLEGGGGGGGSRPCGSYCCSANLAPGTKRLIVIVFLVTMS